MRSGRPRTAGGPARPVPEPPATWNVGNMSFLFLVASGRGRCWPAVNVSSFWEIFSALELATPVIIQDAAMGNKNGPSAESISCSSRAETMRETSARTDISGPVRSSSARKPGSAPSIEAVGSWESRWARCWPNNIKIRSPTANPKRLLITSTRSTHRSTAYVLVPCRLSRRGWLSAPRGNLAARHQVQVTDSFR